MYKQVYIR